MCVVLVCRGMEDTKRARERSFNKDNCCTPSSWNLLISALGGLVFADKPEEAAFVRKT